MKGAQQFPFVVADSALQEASMVARLPISIAYKGANVIVPALLDTGSTINVLPYEVGLQLGAVWEERKTEVQLTGNLANESARALVVSATIGSFKPVRLAFAWTRAERVPVILGQVNFFLEF